MSDSLLKIARCLAIIEAVERWKTNPDDPRIKELIKFAVGTVIIEEISPMMGDALRIED